MSRFLVFLFIFFASASALAQPTLMPPKELKRDSCPEGKTCLSQEQAAAIKGILQHHNCMVDAARQNKIRVSLQDRKITVTEDGQVFTDDTVTGTLEWCDWKLKLRGKNNVTIIKQEPKPPPTWGFRLRVKMGFGWLPSQFGLNFKDMFDPLLAFEPFYWRLLHIQAHVGLQQVGLSLGADLTKNLDIFGGASVQYSTGSVIPVFGMSISFN